jgi:hypothetical protein
MSKLKKIIILTTTGFLFSVSSSYAAQVSIEMVAASDAIQGLDQAIRDIKQQTPLNVVFPSNIPAPENDLYVSYSSYSMNPNYKLFWQISADATPNCKGMRVCNIGVVTAEKGRKVELTYDNLPDQKKLPKQRVTLQNGTAAYYTPTHTSASRIYSTIEWQKNGVLYTMRWKVINVSEDVIKQVIITMINSPSLLQ